MADTEVGVKPNASNHVICWACNVVVQVPYVHGIPAEVFKCGWCGAITDQQLHSDLLHTTPSHKNTNRRCSRLLISLSGWAVVAVVTVIIASIVGLGAFCLLPRVWDTQLSFLFHVLWTVTLTVNVTFNYYAAIICSAGKVSECFAAAPPGTQVQQQTYRDFTFCRHCRYMKPPGVHHCRACHSCVVDMDHHCPFINNCVGRANLRNFLLFLFWTLLSAVYLMLLTIRVMLHNMSLIKEVVTDASKHSNTFKDIMYSTVLVVDMSPWWLLGTVYLFACSIGMLVGIGLLFFSQVRYILKGVSYIQSLKGTTTEVRLVGYAHLCSILGSSNPLMWLVPRWGPAKGVILKDSPKKNM